MSHIGFSTGARHQANTGSTCRVITSLTFTSVPSR